MCEQLAARLAVEGLTTNRIAVAAGVSIGSLYQYFPDKRAIYAALRDRHIDELSQLVSLSLVSDAESSLEVVMRGLLDAMIQAHAIDPAVHALTLGQLPHGPEPDFEQRLRGALRLAIGSRTHEFARPPDLERVLFGLVQMLEALVHGVVLRRPAALSLAAAREEAMRAVLAYLQAHGYRAKGASPRRR